jgi:hypothetical protein
MKKSAFRFLFIILSAGLMLGSSSLLWAQAPDIDVQLIFDKAEYEYGEPIGAEVIVSNQSGAGILVNRGFGSLVYYLEMRVIDPAGRLVVATREDFHDEFPDAPPLAWILHNNKPIRVAGCESLPAGWTSDPSQGRVGDLREYYDISLPGYYSAEVQLSVMTFTGEVTSGGGAACEVDAYDWQGVIKSDTVYFQVQASSQINVEGASAPTKLTPEKWKLSWLEDKKGPNKILVEITPQGDLKVADFIADSIKLNNNAPLKIKEKDKKIELEYDSKLALESLGAVQVGQRHRVLISGRLRSGALFGAEQEIKLEK